MPKRYGNIWTSIHEIDNVKKAARKTLNRRRQKGHWGTQEIYIDEHFDEVCNEIQRSLKERTYDFGQIYHFRINERGKERIIDHLDVYHAIYLECVLEIIQPLFISRYIKTTYSSIPKRGLISMNLQIRNVIHKHPDYHFILLDAKKCYGSVNHEIMIDILKSLFKDIYLIEFFEKLIATLPTGLAIGFSTNHYLVNLLFSNLDHRLTKIKNVYIFRYMDDILILAPKKQLPSIYQIITEETNKIKQKLKPNTRFAPISYGIHFCGFIYYPDKIKLKHQIKQNIYRTDKHLRKVNAPDEEYKQKMAAYWGWIKYSDEKAMWLHVLKDKRYLFEKQMIETKYFKDIATGEDKREQYEGEYWRKGDIIDKEVRFIKFRKANVHGKEKYIIQAQIDDTYGYFFTQAIGITDKLERYKEELPFIGTIKELTNKTGQKYLTII